MITPRICSLGILTYLARGFISCDILRCKDWEYYPMHLVWLTSRGPFDSGKHLRLKRDEVFGGGKSRETWKAVLLKISCRCSHVLVLTSQSSRAYCRTLLL